MFDERSMLQLLFNTFYIMLRGTRFIIIPNDNELQLYTPMNSNIHPSIILKIYLNTKEILRRPLNSLYKQMCAIMK